MGAKLTKLGEFIESKQKKASNSETGHDPAIHGAQLQDRFFNNDSFSNVSFEQSAPDKQEAATKIQTQYRQHAATKEVGAMREEEAAIKIQAGVRGYIDRQRVLEKKDPEEYARRQKEIERRMSGKEYGIDFNDPDVENAAVKIQAGFKGYKARKETHEKQEKLRRIRSLEEKIHVKLDDPDVQSAAVKIQAQFKGYKTRKEIKASHKDEHDGKTEKPDEAPKDEEVDIDLNDPDVEKAATKIQASFKGYKARKEVQHIKEEKLHAAEDHTEVEPADETTDIDLNDPEKNKAAVKIQSNYRGYRTRKDSIKHKKKRGHKTEEIDIDRNDLEKEKAAVKIQSSYRGYKTRKDIIKQKKKMGQETEEIDIDLDDPATEKAALKIQSSFRGYKTRKGVIKNKKDQDQPGESETTAEAPAEEAVTGETDDKTKEEEIDIDLNDPEVEKAAIKIQSGFKGYKVRQGMKTDEKTEDGTVQDDEKKEEGDDEKKEGETEEGAEGETKEGEKKGEEVDIDLNDPEVEQAAIKIQAGFKGFKARKDIQHAKEEKPTEETTEEKPADDEAGDQ